MHRFEVRIAGQLSPRRAAALDCGLRLLASGDSVLLFEPVDGTALYGLLARLRDAGLELMEVRPADPAPNHTKEARDGDR